MGFPQLNFWKYLVLPHVLLALVVVGVIWKRGMLHTFPTAYILGFVALLALAMIHQQNYLRNQNDWRGCSPFQKSCIDIKGMNAIISSAIESRGSVLTIDAGSDVSSRQRWNGINFALKEYWESLINLTNQLA